VISVSTFPNGTFGIVSDRVPRTCKRLSALDIATCKSVPTVCYRPRDAQGLETVYMNSLDSLREPELKPPSLGKFNVLWQSARLLTPCTLPRPNWCGYMQTVCHGDHPGVSGVEMLGIIDLSPSVDDCIYSTLLFVMQ